MCRFEKKNKIKKSLSSRCAKQRACRFLFVWFGFFFWLHWNLRFHASKSLLNSQSYAKHIQKLTSDTHSVVSCRLVCGNLAALLQSSRSCLCPSISAYTDWIFCWERKQSAIFICFQHVYHSTALTAFNLNLCFPSHPSCSTLPWLWFCPDPPTTPPSPAVCPSQ